MGHLIEAGDFGSKGVGFGVGSSARIGGEIGVSLGVRLGVGISSSAAAANPVRLRLLRPCA